MKRMIMDIDGFNALITHIQELNYEVREKPLEGGIVLNEIMSEDGAVVGAFKTFEGGIPFDTEERDALNTVIEALENCGLNDALNKLRKKFPHLFAAAQPMSDQNKARATRVGDLIADYSNPHYKNADEMLGDMEAATTTAVDAMSDCMHLVQYAVERDSMGSEDREYMNEFVVIHMLESSVSVRRCVAEALYSALNHYTCESRGEE